MPAASVGQGPVNVPRLHPKLADIYRQKVASLEEELNRPGLRTEAAEAIRALIDEIRLTPEEGRLEIDLAGDLAGILALTSGKTKPISSGDGLVPITLVAGTRNHRQFSISVQV